MHANPTTNDIAVADDLRALGVRHIFVFGSVARGEAHINSDVDLAVDA